MKLLIIVFLVLGYYMNSQPYSNDILVLHSNTSLTFPWVGGFDNPRFQNIDLNQDGFLDLVLFDASDQKLLTFLHDGTSNSTHFVFAPEYLIDFPENLFNWILLVDYNLDG